MPVRAERRLARDLVADGPQRREEAQIDAFAQHLHGSSLGSEDVAADDPLHDLQVMEPPEDGPLVSREELLGDLIEIFHVGSATVDIHQRDPSTSEERNERGSGGRGAGVDAPEPG